jgi:hypothetical protein
MDSTQLDYLDSIVERVAAGDRGGYSVLSPDERLYVALAANSCNLLFSSGYTVAQALQRLDPGVADELARRWQYVSWDDFAAKATAGAATRRGAPSNSQA